MSVEFGTEVSYPPTPVRPPIASSGTSFAIPLDTKVPDQAGGLNRNRQTETVIPDLLKQVRSQLPGTLVASDSLSFAVYHDPDVTAPNGDILLVRGTTTDPDGMLAVARDRPRQQGAPTEFTLDDGTRALCTQSTNSGGLLVPACAWVTATAFGQIAPLVPLRSSATPPSTPRLAEIVREMLPDLR